MRYVLAALVFVAACGRPEEPPPLPETTQAVQTPWFICDGIDAPTLLLFHRDDETVRVAEYDKPNGALLDRYEYTLSEPEGAAGSVIYALQRDGADAGYARHVNPGMLEAPASAYTTPFTSVQLDEHTLSCRWLPRTRVLGFTGRRSFVVHEDADGDLIYTTYDFASAAQAQRIELSENGRTTTFSAEVRGGDEMMSPNGVSYRFAADDGIAYVLTLNRDGTGQLDVMRNGESVQSEPLTAYVQGSAEAAALPGAE